MQAHRRKRKSLNPYSIGIWSATRQVLHGSFGIARLNPYSIGIWSATFLNGTAPTEEEVLILILLEYGLRQATKST